MAIPFARSVARFSTRYGNRILGPITWYLPGFGRIEHLGRQTGRRHVTPMMAFRSPDGRRMTFALTYGPEAHWVRNVLAAGELTYLSRRDGRLHLVEPTLVHDPHRRATPWAVRQILRILRVDDFLVATVDS
jgi:hypothetical protein